MYGSLEGTVVKSGVSASAGDCCDSCKGTAGCNTWNFCYCELGCAGGVAKGTCVLKNQGNAFYPRCARRAASRQGSLGCFSEHSYPVMPLVPLKTAKGTCMLENNESLHPKWCSAWVSRA